MTTDHKDEAVALSRDAALRVIERAARLDDTMAGAISIEDLRATAADVGVSADAFAAAVREESAGLLTPLEKKPFLVRIGSVGAPDRRSINAMYWLFWASISLAPFILRLPWSPVNRGSVFVGFVAFCCFSLWSTAKTIRWYDQHGWSRLWDKESD